MIDFENTLPPPDVLKLWKTFQSLNIAERVYFDDTELEKL